VNYINISANRNNPEVVDFLPFRCLGNYIADKEHDHAKVDCFWAVNCVSGDSLDVLAEINDEIEWISGAKGTKTSCA
jgi:hypothetical protein